MKDIILVLSDQHSGLAMSMHNPIICTPNLEKIAQTSQYFENAYCNNPLCVPSRMSFLTGRDSSETGIFDNDVVLPSDVPTIADKLKEKGYRTVLIGRMHFKGEDQHHGFEERYVGDITTQWWNMKRNDLGAFQGTLQMKGCLKEFGYGDSPVQDYDETVIEKALEVLKQKDDRPLFAVIGLYGPHFPYCVKDEYFHHYFEKNLNLGNYHNSCWEEYSDMQMNADEETLQNIRSAYYGLVEKMDGMIGKVHETVRNEYPDSIFIYTSDHGEQIGIRKLFGKKACYEESVRIPMIVEDLGLRPEKHVNEVSLLNLHSQICKYADIESNVDDLSTEKPVKISSLIQNQGKEMISQVIIKNRFKYVRSGDIERLIQLDQDLYEENDVKDLYPEIYSELKACQFNEDTARKNIQMRKDELSILKQQYQLNPQEDWIRYKIKEEATKKPNRRSYGEV